VPSSPVPIRQGRGEQLRRARAAAQLLRTVLPAVTQLRIELTFKDGSSTVPAAQAHVLYPPAPAFFTYRCPRSDCDGELELANAVRDAMLREDHTATGSLPCRGIRPGEGGAKHPCEVWLTYTISASVNDVT